MQVRFASLYCCPCMSYLCWSSLLFTSQSLHRSSCYLHRLMCRNVVQVFQLFLYRGINCAVLANTVPPLHASVSLKGKQEMILANKRLSIPCWITEWWPFCIVSILFNAFVHQMSHIVLPKMAERKRGAIVNISASASIYPNPQLAVYAACKVGDSTFSEFDCSKT